MFNSSKPIIRDAKDDDSDQTRQNLSITCTTEEHEVIKRNNEVHI